MSTFALAAICGTIGSLVMFSSLVGAYRFHLTRVNAASAFDALLSHLHMKTPLPPIVAKVAIGIFFAIFYVGIVRMLPVKHPATILMATQVLGFVHGFGISALDVVLVAESHPQRAYRYYGWQVVGAHFVGHQIYGLVIGILLSTFLRSYV